MKIEAHFARYPVLVDMNCSKITSFFQSIEYFDLCKKSERKEMTSDKMLFSLVTYESSLPSM